MRDSYSDHHEPTQEQIDNDLYQSCQWRLVNLTKVCPPMCAYGHNLNPITNNSQVGQSFTATKVGHP